MLLLIVVQQGLAVLVAGGIRLAWLPQGQQMRQVVGERQRGGEPLVPLPAAFAVFATACRGEY
jgi:hypothetical protein